MANGKVFRLGLQKGSLNDRSRGCTSQRLFGAGFYTNDYHPKSENLQIKLENCGFILGSRMISQGAPEALYDGNIDGLIAGADYIEEWRLRGKPNIRLADLGFGHVKLVVGVSDEDAASIGEQDFYEHALRQRDSNGPKSGNPLVCHTEFPYIAMDNIMKSQPYVGRFGDAKPILIEASGSASEGNSKVVIKHVLGNTEQQLTMGADYILEVSQSGESFRNARITSVRHVMDSEAGLYVSDRTNQDPELMNIANYLAWMLNDRTAISEEPVNPDKRYIVKAHVLSKYLADVERSIKDGGFCDLGPSVSPVHGTEFNGVADVQVVVPISKWPEYAFRLWEFKCEDPKAVSSIIRYPISHSLD